MMGEIFKTDENQPQSSAVCSCALARMPAHAAFLVLVEDELLVGELRTERGEQERAGQPSKHCVPTHLSTCV